MKELMTVKKFSETSPDLYRFFKDYSNQQRALRGAVGKQFSTDLSIDQKDKAINVAFATELERRSKTKISDYEGNLAQYCANPIVRSFADAIVDNMIEMVLPETLFGSIGLIADIRFGGFLDSFSFDIKNNALFTVSKAGFRQKTAPAQKLENTTVTLTPENHEVSVISSLPAILANRESLAEYIMKVVRSIETTMLYEVYDGFNTAFDAVTFPSNLKITNYTEDEAIRVAETVTAYNNGKKAMFVGTPVALKKILPSSLSTRILLDDEYVKNGHLTVFNTYDVLPLAQIADYESNDYSLKLDDTKVYILSTGSDKIMKVAVAGGSLSHTDGTYDNANLAQLGTVTKAWATACITNSVAGVIELS